VASDNNIYLQAYAQPTYVYVGDDGFAQDQGTGAMTCSAANPQGANGPGAVTCTDGTGTPSSFQTCTDLGNVLITSTALYDASCTIVTLTGVCN